MAKVNPRNAAANKPAANAAAKPGTADDKAAKEKVEKVIYPGLVGPNDPETGEPTRVQISEWPADYDRAIHKPLLRRDFENEAVWLDHRAEELETRAAGYRKEAEVARKLGNKQDRQKAKQFTKMLSRMEELKAALIAAGMDPEELAQMAADDEDEADE